MSGGGDDERPRRSWSEIDKLRDRPRSHSDERRPRGAAAEARSSAATKQYLGKVGDRLFAGGKGDDGNDEARLVREAHGTKELAEACRSYLEKCGTPDDASLAALFLDADAVDVEVAGLEALTRLHAAGGLALSSGMRTQLRLLSESTNDDVAYLAEELLG
jgi:hypothetical protein